MSNIKNKTLFTALLVLIVLIFAKFLFTGFDWRFALLGIVSILLILYLLSGKTAKFFSKAIFAFTLLITGITFLGFPKPEFAKPTGSYTVGVSTFEVFDAERNRTLPSKAWFPLDKAVDVNTLSAAPWVSHQTEFKQAIAQPAKIPSFMFGHLDSFSAGFSANLNQVAKTDKPIVLLSHGRGAIKSFNTFHALELASQGYIVLAPDHSKGALVTVTKAGEVIPFDPAQFGDGIGLNDDAIVQKVRELGQRWSKDLTAVAKHFKNQFPEYASRQIISGGHSTGGGASIEYCAQTNECLGTIALDPWMEPVSENLLNVGSNKPVLSFFSDPKEKFFEPINRERYERFEKATSTKNVFIKEFVIDRSGHIDFCDGALLSPYSYLLGQDKGRIDTHKVMHIINRQGNLFADSLATEKSVEAIQWEDFAELIDWE